MVGATGPVMSGNIPGGSGSGTGPVGSSGRATSTAGKGAIGAGKGAGHVNRWSVDSEDIARHESFETKDKFRKKYIIIYKTNPELQPLEDIELAFNKAYQYLQNLRTEKERGGLNLEDGIPWKKFIINKIIQFGGDTPYTKDPWAWKKLNQQLDFNFKGREYCVDYENLYYIGIESGSSSLLFRDGYNSKSIEDFIYNHRKKGTKEILKELTPENLKQVYVGGKAKINIRSGVHEQIYKKMLREELEKIENLEEYYKNVK